MLVGSGDDETATNKYAKDSEVKTMMSGNGQSFQDPDTLAFFIGDRT